MDTFNSPDELASYWQQQITAWQATDLTQADYCKQNDLLYHRFIYWKQKFTSQRTVPVQSKSSGGFVKVAPHKTESGLSVTLPGGMVIRGIREDNLPLVCQLAGQLA